MSIKRLKELCLQFSDAVSQFKEECNKIAEASFREQEGINARHHSATHNINTALNTVEQECIQERNRRQTILRHALDSVNSELNDIPDSHWHRMKSRYYATVGDELITNYTDMPVTELFGELDTLLNTLYKEAQQLRDAFVPPGMANAIGFVIHPYRKKKYKRLATAREKILRCTEAIWTKTDIQDRQTFAEGVKSEKAAELAVETSERLARLPAKKEEAIKAKAQTLFDIGEELIRQGFLLKKDLPVGNLLLEDSRFEIIKHFPAEYAKYLGEGGLSIPVSLVSLDKNIVFYTDDEEKMADIFTTAAVNLLLKDINTKIVFADIECMGGSYSSLSKLEREGCVTVWRTEENLRQGLEELCQRISETYRDVLGDTYQTIQEYNASAGSAPIASTYVFVDDINTITGNARDLLRRIIKNGSRSGVYILMNVCKNSSLSKSETDFFTDMLKSSECFMLEHGEVVLSENVRLRLERTASKNNITEVYDKSSILHQQKSVIHLGPKLPQAGHWQGKSSATGIEIAIGVDQDGKDKTLVLSEDKPYTLIIGDVDTGKSSLLHSILIQAMANYGDSEVKIAIGDFKDGAEFNTYATSNLRSVEAVVDNEDPDVMASFLRFYIEEMHRRQALFEQLEACTNKLVRKYETYRAVWEECGYPTAEMPRILLVVDEYQSLFENVSGTAAMLNELVRKGRTYGMHIIMASQRATSDNPRNSFTGDLKNYFTSRFVFKSPQTAARSMLSERCADTGRENSGISRAALLNKGCAIYNSYMGQTERDNCEVQCFYATDELIKNVCKVLSAINGVGTSILLKKGAHSVIAPCGNADEIGLGISPCLKVDAGNEHSDDIIDDVTVAIKAKQPLHNILCCGSDGRIAVSVLNSTIRHVDALGASYEVHVFGANQSNVVGLCLADLSTRANVYFHTTEQAIREELSRQMTSSVSCINLFAEMSDYPMLAQTASALRTTPESNLLKQLLSEASTAKRINIIQSKSFKNLRNNFAQVVGATPICLLGVGELENIRSATSDSCRITNSEFDVPKKNAINAYYYNRNTDKFGKVILYQP